MRNVLIIIIIAFSSLSVYAAETWQCSLEGHEKEQGNFSKIVELNFDPEVDSRFEIKPGLTIAIGITNVYETRIIRNKFSIAATLYSEKRSDILVAWAHISKLGKEFSLGAGPGWNPASDWYHMKCLRKNKGR